MRNHGTIWVCILGSLIFCAKAEATAANPPGNPYQAIVARNVFGLQEPPAPAPTEPVKPPAPKITLTGITTIGGKRALLSTPPLPGRTPADARAQYYTLAEGQRDGELEVLAIDAQARTVKVSYGGTVETLDFKENGIKPASAPQAGLAAAGPQAGNPSIAAARDAQGLATQLSRLDPEKQAVRALIPTQRTAAGALVPGTWRRSVRPPMPQ